jgi:hypothetical protein
MPAQPSPGINEGKPGKIEQDLMAGAEERLGCSATVILQASRMQSSEAIAPIAC